MTEYRRDGRHPNRFSQEIRQISGGGTIPDEWGCRAVDLDVIYMIVADEVLQVNTEGRIWVWYDHAESPRIVALAELKLPSDIQQSWAVTRSLARRCGVPGFKVVRQLDGKVLGEDIERVQFVYGSARAFIDDNIRPLIAAEVAA